MTGSMSYSSHGRAGGGNDSKIWYCYFLLGAGVLAPWNAFITATDYYGAAFPGRHVDRLFTVCYLPTCLLALLIFLISPNPAWLPGSHIRITACYAAFTALLFLVPVVNTFDVTGSSSTQQGSLPMLMLAVVLVGALDGACQGAVFSDAAHYAPEYTQAVAAGTACSGLLVSVLRVLCKAAWAGAAPGPGATPPPAAGSIPAGMRASTATYFAFGAVVTGCCCVAYHWVLPRLLASSTHHNHTAGLAHQPGNSHDNRCEMTPLAVTLSLARPFLSGDSSEPHGVPPRASREDAPLLAPADQVMATSDAPGTRQTDGCGAGQQQGPGRGSARSTARDGSSHAVSLREEEAAAADDDDNVVLLGSLLLGDHQEAQHTGQGTGWKQAVGGHLVHMHHVHQQQQLSSSPAGDTTLDGAWQHDIKYAPRLQQLRFCLAHCWPQCAALFLTYACTLCIFPGVLAEDIHSDVLGEWYPLLVITTFNAADLAGKLLGPSHQLATHSATDTSTYTSDVFDPGCFLGNLEASLHAHYTAFLRKLSARPVLLTALSVARGIKVLAVFAIAASFSAPPWIILPATIMLGASNGWLTVAAMAQGPLLVPAYLAEPAEGVLVVSLVAGLLVGALLGWVWLL